MKPDFTNIRKRIPRIPDQPLAFIIYVLRHCSLRMKVMAFLDCLFIALATASDVMVAWVLGRIVGVIINSGDRLWVLLSYEIALLAGLWIFRNISYRFAEFCERHYISELLNTTRELLFNRLIQQSLSFLHSNFAGVLANHVRRTGEVISSLRDKIQYNIVPLLVRFVTSGILLWQITPLFVAFMTVFLVIGIAGAFLTSSRWTSLSTKQAEAYSHLTGYIVDGVTNLSLVQQNVGWREEQKRLYSAHEGINDAFVNRLTYYSWFWGIFDLVMTLFYCGFMVILAYSWQTGNVTTAQLAMTVGIVTNLFGAIAGTVNLLSAKFDDIGILKDSLQKIASPLSVYDKPAASDLNVTAGKIEFRNVTFGYGPEEKIFDSLNLEIASGERVGLVGISGTGKTTICQLLLRAYDVDGGGIYIDGQNIAEITQDSLHDAIAVIPQDPSLFHRTLGENISYGRPMATESDIVNAATSASISSFIDTLPQGYQTLVGERGVKLSGGQRQRIAIARAIVKNSPILVLDEATSALDSETEKEIQQAILCAMEGRTTLVVAHRLSTLRHMDRIIVMDNGRIIEDGNFATLISQGGTFKKLWDLQAGGFLSDSLSE